MFSILNEVLIKMPVIKTGILSQSSEQLVPYTI